MPKRRTARLAARWLLPALVVSLTAGTAAAGTLSMTLTRFGEPLPDPTLAKFYVFEPEERTEYLGWGHTDKPVRVPDGIYDVVVRYHNDTVTEERVLEGLAIEGEVRRRIDFEISEATLTVAITDGRDPVPRYAGQYSLYRAGERGRPVASRRPGSAVTVRPGVYDIEVTYRDDRGLKSRWLERYRLEGVHYETVVLGTAPARLTVTLLDEGRELGPGDALWRVYEPGQRSRYLAERDSGESADLRPGRYDVGVFVRRGRSAAERWLPGVEVFGDVRREIEVSPPAAELRVDIVRGRRLLRGAWFTIFAAGDRTRPLGTGRSGTTIAVRPGDYDIACYYAEEGLQAERWLHDQRVGERLELEVDLEFERATLRVLPSGSERLEPAPRRPAVLLVLDSSTTMGRSIGGRSRMELARRTIGEVVQDPRLERLDVGLRVFGIAPRVQADCGDSTLVVPVAPLDGRRISATLDLLRPSGLAPIAYSLERAAEDLPADSANTVVLLASDVDGCGGAPCEVAARLVRQGLIDRLHVVGLGLGGAQRAALDCVGEYHDVDTSGEVRIALRRIFRDALEPEPGRYHVLRPDGGAWVATGELGQAVDLAAGSYDVLIRDEGRTYSWTDVEVRGTVEAPAGPDPPALR